MIINWLKGQYAAALNEENLAFDTPRVSADLMADLLNKLQDNIISLNNARTIFHYCGLVKKILKQSLNVKGFVNQITLPFGKR